MMKIKYVLASLVMCIGLPMMAQKQFTLDDLLWGGKSSYNLRPESRYLGWWGNKAIETTVDDVRLVSDGSVIISVDSLNAIAGEKVFFSGHNLSLPFDGQPIVHSNTGRKRIQVNYQTGKVEWQQQVPADAELQDFNLHSRNLAFTRQGNLYVLTADGKELQVSTDGSTDGSSNIVYGQSVHRDEFGITKGTFWSPDGSQLAFYRMDQSMVPSYPQVDITKRIASTYTDHYPMAGESGHEVSVGVFDVKTSKTIWLELEGEKDDYHTNISWSPDGKTIYVFELNRDQNDMRLVAYSAETGKHLRTLLQECDEKYVEPLHGLVFLPWDSSKAIMQSQRDGYNHLYLVDINSAVEKVTNGSSTSHDHVKVTQLTSGQWVVQQFVGFNQKDKSLIYLSNESDPRRSCLYSVSIKGGKRTLVSADDGVHYATLSADGQQVIDQYTSPTVPRSINLLSTRGGKSQNILTAADPWKEQGYNYPEITSGSIKAADGVTDLYYRMVKPVGFDPSKKYPTVIYVYGGPHAHNVDASWHWNLRGWEAYMAQKGYLMFILDNRGSEWRGKEFEQTTFRQLGEVEVQDQMQGVKYLQSLPYVDKDRMGVHGWSFGGFMTTNLMCTHPEVFKVGVAGGPVIDWKYYEVMYGERYMDTPQQNPEGYAKCSLVNKAKNLKGRLQIITGYEDPTCVQQHTLDFLRACIEAGTQPDFFTYPGEGHNMRGHKQVHLHERITRYFEDHLK